MISVIFHIFLLIFAHSARPDFIEKTAENYGPYTLEMQQMNTCRGPKLSNLTTYTTTLMKESNLYHSALNVTFLDQTKIDNLKMSVYTVKNGQKSLLWNYMVNKPCQHYAMSKVLETYVNAHNCVVKKGTYYSMMNLTEIAKSYLGNSFFYGEFIFKAVVLSQKGNIICLIYNPLFKKSV